MDKNIIVKRNKRARPTKNVDELRMELYVSITDGISSVVGRISPISKLLFDVGTTANLQHQSYGTLLQGIGLILAIANESEKYNQI